MRIMIIINNKAVNRLLKKIYTVSQITAKIVFGITLSNFHQL